MADPVRTAQDDDSDPNEVVPTGVEDRENPYSVTAASRIYFLPNLMTACNLACGFFAVLMIFRGLIEVGNADIPPKEYYSHVKEYYEYAILLIFGSCLFDLLDGRLARLASGPPLTEALNNASRSTGCVEPVK